MALLSIYVFGFGCCPQCRRSPSLEDLIHIYSSRFIVRKVTLPLEDLWRNACPLFISFLPPPSFTLFVFLPSTLPRLWECKMIKNAQFHNIKSSLFIFLPSPSRSLASPTACFFLSSLHGCRLVAHALSSLTLWLSLKPEFAWFLCLRAGDSCGRVVRLSRFCPIQRSRTLWPYVCPLLVHTKI